MSSYGSLSSIDKTNSFKWRVPNFLHSIGNTGQAVRSPLFTVWDINNKSGDFFLKIYPKGEKKDTSDFVALYLENNSPIELTLSYKFSIEGMHSNKLLASPLSKFKHGEGWGCQKLFKINDLMENSATVFTEGSISIVLEIVKPGPESPFASLAQDLEKTYMNITEFADVKISSNGKTFNCHKVLLASRSPVLRAMCQGDFKEGITGIINMDSMDPVVIEELLSFIYSGKVKDLDANAIELMKAADIYQIDNLKDVCGYHLSSKISTVNCLSYLVLGDTYRSQHLKDSAMNALKSEIKVLMMTQAWKVAKKQHPELIMELMENTIQQKKV